MTDIHEANGARFIAKDDMIVRWERAEGRPFEPETTGWLFMSLALRPGWLVDVGAATGWFAIPAALSHVRVIAVEPNPAVRDRLRQNMAENALVEPDEITVVPAAASAGAGTATFWHNPNVPLTSGGSIECPTCNRPSQITVPTVALDTVCAGLEVALIKIDVEGHEMSVLAGAEATIARCRPYLVLEANTDAHREQLAGWLAAHGYSWERADERNMLCTPLEDGA